MNYDIHISSMVVPVKYTQHTSQEVLVGNKRKGVCGGEGGGESVVCQVVYFVHKYVPQ